MAVTSRKVIWQPEIARLRVSRVVSVIDAGRILNPLAGRNQIQGAVVMGIGMALLEHTSYDPQNRSDQQQHGRLYCCGERCPAHRSVFPRLPDKEINELGARGIGEIGLAGIAAAITDAVHHATGVRVREKRDAHDRLLGDVKAGTLLEVALHNFRATERHLRIALRP